MKNVLAVLRRKHRPNTRALSAYLDRAVSADEAAAIEAHVATCVACARELAGLQAVRSLLSSLPQADVPRSFHLRPADIAPQARPQASLALRLMPALSGAAAVAFAVLLAVSFSGIGQHHSNATSPEAARFLAAGASSTGTSAAAPGTSGAKAVAPTAPTPGGPAAAGAQVPAATPANVQAQPAAPVTNPDQGAEPSTGTSAATSASNSLTDTANSPEKALAPPAAAHAGTPSAGEATTSAQTATSSSSDRDWLLWATVAVAVVALASGAVSVRTWARRQR